MLNNPLYRPGPVVQNTASPKPTSKRVTYGPGGVMTGQTDDYGPSLDDELATREKYNAQADARRQASLQALMGSYGGSQQPPTQGGHIRYDEQAARDNAFARAKDKAGQIARSSVNSLREMMGGNLGGALEASRMAEVAGGAANQLGEFNRDQLMTDLNRASEISNRERAAGLTERGQNIDSMRTLMSLFSGGGRLY